ncbi:DeoR/GlpR family DNA-binding transcription regulator [Chitinivorax sp. B]|uniref:DeoR/GlpR family DNA-binding transcription regulator n=1 Tax=Chitinivorax sp. B TaxID=2502235 RepID=UPI0010F736BE|nr:DeoR/GlpR family DNA-binding transcription regulator [Chitinivorax sp. B]
MLTSQRRKHLLDVLQREGQVIARVISDQLGVSEDTIRRDLRTLAQEGLCQRVHGGALPASPAMGTLAARQGISIEAKRHIGEAAARMVQPGQVIFVDGGTTTTQLARSLPRDLHATVVTHSPAIAVELGQHPHIDVVMIGGQLFKHSMVAVGAAAAEAIRRIRADIYFMGACSLHIQAGISTGDLEEAHIKRMICEASAETVVLASPEKLDTASPYTIVPLSEVDAIITVRDIPEEQVAPYRTAGLSVVRV